MDYQNKSKSQSRVRIHIFPSQLPLQSSLLSDKVGFPQWNLILLPEEPLLVQTVGLVELEWAVCLEQGEWVICVK